MRYLDRRYSVFFLCLAVFLAPVQAHSQDAGLTNIIVTNTRDDLLLYLTVKDAFPAKIEETIHSGVPATFSFFVNLFAVRDLWFDKQIAEIKVTHSLKYDNLKKEYTVTRSWEGGKLHVVKSYEEAKELMSEIDSLTIVPLDQLEKGNQYQIRAKAELNKLTLPFYLHYVLFFVSLWDFETDWYTIDFIY
jgi:predicted DNA-binding protein YlxM (UPF0122 family)